MKVRVGGPHVLQPVYLLLALEPTLLGIFSIEAVRTLRFRAPVAGAAGSALCAAAEDMRGTKSLKRETRLDGEERGAVSEKMAKVTTMRVREGEEGARGRQRRRRRRRQPRPSKYIFYKTKRCSFSETAL
jgi:hypothetical protein